MKMSLTPTQSRLRAFILGFMENKGHAPCYREMGEAMGGLANSSIHRLMVGLEERGAIRRLPGRQRAIEIVTMPVPVSTAPDGAPLYFVPIGGDR